MSFEAGVDSDYLTDGDGHADGRSASEEVRGALDAALAAAWATLDSGDVSKARAVAKTVLGTARATCEVAFEAHALSCLAQADRVDSRLRRSSEAARRAAQLFKQVGNSVEEARALTTLAHACMLLGRNDEAVEAALLSSKLADQGEVTPHNVLAYNVLGIAYAWSGNFEGSDAALDYAIDLAGQCRPPLSSYQPRVNKMWVEASRLLEERYQSGRIRNLDRLRELVGDCQALETRGLAVSAMPGLQTHRVPITIGTYSLLASWQGEFERARTLVDQCRQTLPSRLTWMHSLAQWCEAELAWSQGELTGAERWLKLMAASALEVEHEQFACRAQLLLAQLYEQQGRFQDALQVHRVLRQRERRIVADSVMSREALVSHQLGARDSEAHLEKALSAARQFERWSLEDALTGIANRRRLELVLEAWLKDVRDLARNLTVAFIDVDKFKSVNDRFTHEVGDRVLKTLASLMAENVRETDLVARWAGDEFVIAFRDSSRNDAEQVCARVRAAIDQFDWNSIAKGLHMSVTIGFSEARPEDSTATLLGRSDVDMYESKPMSLDR